MSNDIRVYKVPRQWFKEAEDMALRAVVGGEKYGRSIQFTIGNSFTVLTEQQLFDLISVISRRLKGDKNFRATDTTIPYSVLEDGTVNYTTLSHSASGD